MILTDEEVKERIESPINLLNRLKSLSTNKNSFKQSDIPSFPPSADELISDLDEKIKYGSIKSKAMGIMTDAMNELKIRIPEVSKPEKLAQIAAEMSKVINSTNIKFEDNRKQAQIVIYAPQMASESQFETVTVSEG